MNYADILKSSVRSACLSRWWGLLSIGLCRAVAGTALSPGRGDLTTQSDRTDELSLTDLLNGDLF